MTNPDTFKPVVVTSENIDQFNDIASEVLDECVAQLELWGQQDHDFAYGPGAVREFARAEAKWKLINQARMDQGRISWDGILLEELFEALAKGLELPAMREELVQVAAVAVSMIDAIDRLKSDTEAQALDELVDEDAEDVA